MCIRDSRDIDTKLELIDVKLQQIDLVNQEAKKEGKDGDDSSTTSSNPMNLADIQPNSDGDYMDSVLDQAEKLRNHDENLKQLSAKKELLQLEKQSRKNKKHKKELKK